MRAIITVLLVSLFVIGCKKKEEPKPAPAATGPAAPAPAPAAQAPGLPQDALSVVTGMMAAFSEGKVDEAVAFFADDHQEISATSSDQPVKGRAALREKWMLQKAAFADLRWAARRIFDAGGVWVIQSVALGTHTGNYRGYAATGEKIGYEFLRWAKVENGQIKRSVLYVPTATIFQQLKGLKGERPPLPTWPEQPEVVAGESNPPNIEKAMAIYKALSEGKYDVAAAASHDDLTMTEFAMRRTVKGLADNRKAYEAQRKAFPDGQMAPEVLVSVGDWVLARGVMTGTHKGEIMGAKPTNEAVAAHFADAIRFDGGKVRSIESYSDPIEILEALGLLAIADQEKPKGP
jgi:predicted ester cyclase